MSVTLQDMAKRAHESIGKWQMGRGLVILTGLVLSTYVGGCAKNTAGSEVDDGRVFFMTDIDPNRLWVHPQYGRGYLLVSTTVEGFEEPVKQVVYAEVNGAPFDLLGQVIEGGSEVYIRAQAYLRGSADLRFNVDGNTTIRLRFKDPRLGYTSVWVLEQL